jgi:hypothetical protein
MSLRPLFQSCSRPTCLVRGIHIPKPFAPLVCNMHFYIFSYSDDLSPFLFSKIFQDLRIRNISLVFYPSLNGHSISSLSIFFRWFLLVAYPSFHKIAFYFFLMRAVSIAESFAERFLSTFSCFLRYAFGTTISQFRRLIRWSTERQSDSLALNFEPESCPRWELQTKPAWATVGALWPEMARNKCKESNLFILEIASI